MSLCVLISTCNRTSLLERTLNRLNQLTHPDEVLVVDDGGADGCEEMTKRLVVDFPVRYLYTHNPGQSMCSHARNVGIKNTDCEWIITSEPEMWWNTDIVAQFLAKHEEHPTDCLNAGTIHHQHHSHHGEMGTPNYEDTTRNWHATWVSFWGRQWLLDIGGWDEDFPDPWGWEDTDLVTRLVASGHGTVIVPEAEATHLWHQHQPQPQDRNEAHFRAKMSPDGATMHRVVANEGHEWGVVKPRP